MKKLILLLAVIAINAGVYAQSDSASRKMNQPHINNTNDGLNQNRDMNHMQNQDFPNKPDDKSQADGVIMLNGKMMKVENGQRTFLDDDMTMTNGTKIKSDGTYTKKDGTKLTMEEGQQLDMSGNLILVKTHKDKTMDLVPDSTRNRDY